MFEGYKGLKGMYDFDKLTDRRNTGSLKWDVPEGELPMWVADMDFETAPEIRAAIREKAEQGIFGYNVLTDDWYRAYTGWWSRRHHFHMERDWLLFSTGVLPIISSTVRKLTTAGENVLVQTPVYNMFFNSIRNNGRNILESPLVYDGREYFVNFEDLEEKLADPQTTLMLVCNPHNPVGKIWELADPVVSPAYTAGLEGTPNEVKLKYLADNDFAALSGEELRAAIKDYIKDKDEKAVSLKGTMVTQGTTPRRLTDLIGSLADLTSGSGDKGTPIIYIQGYFDNYTK